MKFNFSQPLVNMNNQIFLTNRVTGIGEDQQVEQVELTVGSVCADCLLTDEQGLNAKDKIDRYELAKKIYEGGVHEITSEQRDLIRDMVGKYGKTVMVGQIIPFLDEPLVERVDGKESDEESETESD